MQSQRNEPIGFDAQDPDGNRLTRDVVIAINTAHLAGKGWDAIANEQGTSRKNVQRIVQGRRWRDLHPNVRPDLYVADDTPRPVDDAIAVIVNDALREARDRIIRELREA
jgi:hypothetical protein